MRIRSVWRERSLDERDGEIAREARQRAGTGDTDLSLLALGTVVLECHEARRNRLRIAACDAFGQHVDVRLDHSQVVSRLLT